MLNESIVILIIMIINIHNNTNDIINNDNTDIGEGQMGSALMGVTANDICIYIYIYI